MRAIALAFLLCSTPLAAATNPVTQPSQLSPEWQARTKAMFKTAIEIPSVVGRSVEKLRMAEFIKSEYLKAGWAEDELKILQYKDRSGGETVAFMARWKAVGPTKLKPMLIIAHMDVVEAKRSDWVLDPFQFVEKDGYFYGRGTSDDKQGVITTSAALFKLRQEGFKPKRDIIVFYTGDEEIDGNGARHGATDWKSMLDAEYALNADAGGGAYLADGTPLGFGVQTAEKIYQDFTFTTTNRGGHSSRPRPDNAIYDLSRALIRLADYRFKPQMTEITRAYFTARAKQDTGALGDAMREWLANENDAAAADTIEANELEVGMTRTRCVATMLNGGHATNALPQKATANVNCRAMPGTDGAALLKELQEIAGPGVTVTTVGDFKPSPPSPLRADVLGAYSRSIARLYGKDVPIIPHMSTGATDGLFFRQVGIPVYGVEGSWGVSPDDERAHGLDERIPTRAFYNNVLHWESMVRDLAGK